ncbi:hypothetical protein Dimus_006057 [Dionaea muscipula]
MDSEGEPTEESGNAVDLMRASSPVIGDSLPHPSSCPAAVSSSPCPKEVMGGVDIQGGSRGIRGNGVEVLVDLAAGGQRHRWSGVVSRLSSSDGRQQQPPLPEVPCPVEDVDYSGCWAQGASEDMSEAGLSPQGGSDDGRWTVSHGMTVLGAEAGSDGVVRDSSPRGKSRGRGGRRGRGGSRGHSRA